VFLLTQYRMHTTMIPSILFVFHLPSYYLTSLALGPLETHLSPAAYNWLVTAMMGCLQAVVIGVLILLFKLRNNGVPRV
jgi:hypothetical protein